MATRICWLTGGFVAFVALVAWFLGGPREAAGAMTGGAITVANFLWLYWTAGLVLRRPRAATPFRRAVWVGASGARFAAVALAFGLAVVQEWVGLGGILGALIALPAAVVGEGLRTAHAG